MESKQTIGIHWGTFTTLQHTRQTIAELKKACREADVAVGAGGLMLADIGRLLLV
jgi:hypothetical protein